MRQSVHSQSPLLAQPAPLHPAASPPPLPPASPPAPTQSVDAPLVIGIDFGTTFSGVSFASPRVNGGRVQQILRWPKALEAMRKVPTCLLYNEQGDVLAWGVEAKHASSGPGLYQCEWFKLHLEPSALRNAERGQPLDPRLAPPPPGKTPQMLVIDYLSCLWEYSRTQITNEISSIADLDSAEIWLTVPAAWDAKGCSMMREAAIKAGLVASVHAGDKAWRDRLKIITEPEAAAVHAAESTELRTLRTGNTFLICDAGGGTVDLSVYKLLGDRVGDLALAELSARSGANIGSIFLDLRFRELVSTLLSAHPRHLDSTSLASFMHAFGEGEKHNYRGEADDGVFFRFSLFNPDDTEDSAVGLENGELSIPGNLLRTRVFDPVINDVVALLQDQLNRTPMPVDAILLVGGFSACEYLYRRIHQHFSQRVRLIARPTDADTATLRGAAEYGLSRRELVSSIVSSRAYIIKVKLPAEQEDYVKRPQFLIQNAGGAPICDNRTQYLVTKEEVVRKRHPIKKKFCKFSQNINDRNFVAVLFTSESAQQFRYTDEGDLVELCKWTVDLGSLPTFQQNAANPHGFYTEFELGLELDSAEVRGVLFYNNEEWGRVTFDQFTQ
ncbi:hypothetical protein BKA62DRAFT_615790 [Auriculariales sp. MPI-PUGE-AT-0066]|nr:hypothetical protein BKA62DRAFT_615790 [Auriculariales sp. MPI-PUGE-AT-0066]